MTTPTVVTGITFEELANLCEDAGVYISEYYDHDDVRYYTSIGISHQEEMLTIVSKLFGQAYKVGLTEKLSRLFAAAKLHNPKSACSSHNAIVFYNLEWMD